MSSIDRIIKVNQQLKREISEIIQRELGDPRVEFVMITHVDTSRDLRLAKVSFSVLGNPKQAEAAGQGLDKARRLIRKLVGQRMTMRYTPELKFYYDQSIEINARLEEKFEEINNESNKDHQSDRE